MKKQKKSKEEIEQEQLKSQLADLRRSYIPNPTIIWNVGDRVQHGNVKQSIIKESLDNGKIYLLDEICTNNNYGNPFDSTRLIHVSWLDIVPYKSDEENNKLPRLAEEDDLRLSFSQREISALFSMAYHFGIDFNPSYQRELCWDISDKVALIHSIFQNIDIGKFTMIERDYAFDGPLYEVLDGKQRINALMEFFEGKFEYKNTLYRNLCWRDMSLFERYPISVAILEDHKVTEKLKLKYFLKLNTTGKPQSIDHINKVKQMFESIKG